MLGNLFKSKRQRESERDLAIQRALAMHRSHAAKLGRHERDYMEKALRAKKAGDRTNFSRLCQMVAQTVNQRRAIESQLLYFETLLQTRDKVRLFKDFATGMKAMAKSINEVFKDFNSTDVLADVESALAKSSHLEDAMGLVLDRISSSSVSEHVPADGVSAGDIERIMGERSTAEDKSTDREIDEGLKAIEQALMREPS